MSKEVVLTGIRANSEIQLGNYLGAILPMINFQNANKGKFTFNMFVPDLHSFTTEIDFANLHDQIIKNLKIFVACGLDIDNQDLNIYRQSYIPAHSELTVILNNFAYYGEVSRMTQFKDKSQSSTNITVGLFDYPVLMASDIILYGAKYIPVGDDQKQHIELTRDLAIRFNNKFNKDIFVAPAPWSEQLKFFGLLDGVRIKSLKNPQNKMSKSVEDPAGTILLSDNPSDAAKKIMSATTDSIGAISYDYLNQPGITNLLVILGLLSRTSIEDIKSKWVGQASYGDLKKETALAVENFLTDYQYKLANVDEKKLHAKLIEGEANMNKVASSKLLEVQKVLGLRD